MKNFEIIKSSFSKWDLDCLVNGFLNNDDNLPAWAVGSLGSISLYFLHNGFGNLDIVAGGFVLNVYVFPFKKDVYKHVPKKYASRSKALPVHVVEISSDEIANLNSDVDTQYKDFIEMVFSKVVDLEDE